MTKLSLWDERDDLELDCELSVGLDGTKDAEVHQLAERRHDAELDLDRDTELAERVNLAG